MSLLSALGPSVAFNPAAQPREVESRAVVGSAVGDTVSIGTGSPSRRLQPPQNALPGTYDRHGRMAEDPAVQVDAEPPVDAEAVDADAAETEDADAPREGSGPLQLTPEEVEIVRAMKVRDQEVRAHEQAHMAVGGALAGAASYTYEGGPDGNRYAVAGEVPISMPSGGDPKQRIADAQTVRRAALAPAKPSGADRAVAAAASQIEAQARAELATLRTEEARQAAEPEETEDAGAEPAEGGTPDAPIE